MTTGWDSLEVPAGPNATSAADDPVSEFGGPSTFATDTPFRDSHVESDPDLIESDPTSSREEEDYLDREAPQAKSKAPLLIGFAVLACVTLGGLWLMLQPMITAFSGGKTATAPREVSALAVEAMKGGSVGGSAAAPAAAAVPETIASGASSPAQTASAVSTGVRQDSPTPPATASVAEKPKQERTDGTANAVAAVLANAKTVEVASANSGTAKGSTVPSAVAASGMRSSAPAHDASAVSQPATGGTSGRIREDRARARKSLAADTQVANADKSGATSRGAKPGEGAAGDGVRRPAEQLVGYSLLAINPRTGDFQQAWVRDSSGRLQIVSAGDRLGSVPVLRIDGSKGEVQTAAGVIR